jgi:maltooligosyltrehalose trehalohydrolase
MKKKSIFPTFSDKHTCEFNLWAPKAEGVKIIIDSPHREVLMSQEDYGYWNIKLDHIYSGNRYKYQIDEGECYPDPASLSQPDGVHGASEVINLKDFNWTDNDWVNIPLDEMIQYELHTGTFTQEGTFSGIRSKIDYFNNLGINAIEIMPVAQFSGIRNWGYDGVYPFAVQDSYGGAKGLMDLVNECHRNGIAVILDVVYNHFGPEGNYVSNFGHYFTGKYSTPWGNPVNFDSAYSDEVRQYVIENALMWCRDFHVDGLRLDAVHAIFDFSAKHILAELSEKLMELSTQTRKNYHLIAESNLNDVRYINPINKGGYGLNAQWSDDFHHSVHALATNEHKGYYKDFGEPLHLSKAIKKVFVYDGQYSGFRKKSYGNSTENNKAFQFVIFNQNHDQVGNRKNGERLISLTGFEMAKLIAGVTMVTPNVPLLFMGEEYGENKPFYYFVSHLDPELNKQVREGREKEFEKFYNSDDKSIDPASPETFNKSKLSWNIEDRYEYKAMFSYYQTLIRLRKEHPVLKHLDNNNLRISENGKLFIMERWHKSHFILVVMNFNNSDIVVHVPSDIKGNLTKIIDSASKEWNGPMELSPLTVTANQEIKISKESILIYSS